MLSTGGGLFGGRPFFCLFAITDSQDFTDGEK